ncbi:hypothetical protein HDU96_002477 [Phlyctochytrium bullatum]|nr:hypothetical protein HDU96_002477 [Phlyctochytrium bullatum]
MDPHWNGSPRRAVADVVPAPPYPPMQAAYHPPPSQQWSNAPPTGWGGAWDPALALQPAASSFPPPGYPQSLPNPDHRWAPLPYPDPYGSGYSSVSAATSPAAYTNRNSPNMPWTTPPNPNTAPAHPSPSWPAPVVPPSYPSAPYPNGFAPPPPPPENVTWTETRVAAENYAAAGSQSYGYPPATGFYQEIVTYETWTTGFYPAEQGYGARTGVTAENYSREAGGNGGEPGRVTESIMREPAPSADPVPAENPLSPFTPTSLRELLAIRDMFDAIPTFHDSGMFKGWKAVSGAIWAQCRVVVEEGALQIAHIQMLAKKLGGKLDWWDVVLEVIWKGRERPKEVERASGKNGASWPIEFTANTSPVVAGQPTSSHRKRKRTDPTHFPFASAEPIEVLDVDAPPQTSHRAIRADRTAQIASRVWSPRWTDDSIRTMFRQRSKMDSQPMYFPDGVFKGWSALADRIFKDTGRAFTRAEVRCKFEELVGTFRRKGIPVIFGREGGPGRMGYWGVVKEYCLMEEARARGEAVVGGGSAVGAMGLSKEVEVIDVDAMFPDPVPDPMKKSSQSLPQPDKNPSVSDSRTSTTIHPPPATHSDAAQVLPTPPLRESSVVSPSSPPSGGSVSSPAAPTAPPYSSPDSETRPDPACLEALTDVDMFHMTASPSPSELEPDEQEEEEFGGMAEVVGVAAHEVEEVADEDVGGVTEKEAETEAVVRISWSGRCESVGSEDPSDVEEYENVSLALGSALPSRNETECSGAAPMNRLESPSILRRSLLLASAPSPPPPRPPHRPPRRSPAGQRAAARRVARRPYQKTSTRFPTPPCPDPHKATRLSLVSYDEVLFKRAWFRVPRWETWARGRRRACAPKNTKSDVKEPGVKKSAAGSGERTVTWEVGDEKAPWYGKLKFGDRLEAFAVEDESWFCARAMYYGRFLESSITYLGIHFDGYSKKWDLHLDIRDPHIERVIRPWKGLEPKPEAAARAAMLEIWDPMEKGAVRLCGMKRLDRERVARGEVVEMKRKVPRNPIFG